MRRHWLLKVNTAYVHRGRRRYRRRPWRHHHHHLLLKTCLESCSSCCTGLGHKYYINFHHVCLWWDWQKLFPPVQTVCCCISHVIAGQAACFDLVRCLECEPARRHHWSNVLLLAPSGPTQQRGCSVDLLVSPHWMAHSGPVHAGSLEGRCVAVQLFGVEAPERNECLLKTWTSNYYLFQSCSQILVLLNQDCYQDCVDSRLYYSKHIITTCCGGWTELC